MLTGFYSLFCHTSGCQKVRMKCFKVCKKTTVDIDNSVFRLHYKVTMPVLFTVCVFLIGFQALNTPNDCDPVENVEQMIVNDHCYSHHRRNAELNLVEAGIIDERMEFPEKTKPDISRTSKSHNPFLIIFLIVVQCILCYLPRFFWSKLESERIRKLLELLENPEQLMNSIFANSNKNYKHFWWYCVAEISNATFDFFFIVIVSSILWKEYFLYGINVILWNIHGGTEVENPVTRIFPKKIPCTFNLLNPTTGGNEIHKTACDVYMNNVNDKVFLVLWFWFLILGILSWLEVFYTATTCVSLRMRTSKLSTKLVEKDKLVTMLKECTPGDWFLIHLLSKNISSASFNDFVSNAVVHLS